MKRMYPNCVPVVGGYNIAFYSLDQQHSIRLPKSAILVDCNAETKGFSLDKVSRTGFEMLAGNSLLVADEQASSNSGLQTIGEYAWHSPSIITNATIEVSTQNGLTDFSNLSQLLDMLAKLLCKHLFIRIVDVMPLAALANLVDKIASSNAFSLQLVLPYDDEYYSNEFGKIVIEQQKIAYIIVENSPFEKNIEDKLFFANRELALRYDKSESQFSVHHSLFEESQKHHTYFNRKLHIGSAGEIKNALETATVFGYIQKINRFDQLREIINTPEFQYYWFAHKGVCAICQDCEYRHMCVDNRVPVCREDGSWEHTQACNYDPYTGQWQ